MRAVFLDRNTINQDISFHAIEQAVDNISYFATTSDEKIVTRAKFADIVITNKVELSAAVIAQLPKLKLICITATGTNNVDLQAAKQANIQVCNVAGYSTASVTQYVFAMLLEFYQQTALQLHDVRQGHWQQSSVFCHFARPVEELADKSMAIVGYGAIGQSVAQVAKAFGMRVLICERRGATSVRPGRVPFEQGLKEADIISLHSPLTPQTENLIDQQTLALMKRSAILINTARGQLVNSAALLTALRSKRIGGAILDVLEQEPPPADHPLLQQSMDNLMITAHIAWGSRAAQQRLINATGANINNYSRGILTNRVV
ncbi:D-2-hydroxyacid dehydrogenase [Thalassotalea mangrovi]|uniref:D-2-hydroxyacid dehydrogenase n=1 Tax=Thalassotalea mangrovi TaxID=2572245 RepID=A0A4U1B8Q7_9GAMM|nr:D-2-hydroxyacid dehydrogenase [Thalassotalea mangrovi]TKB46905.1 D-2-hydroxyacid dehydrogenase [Thalassotalea mangrovi]